MIFAIDFDGTIVEQDGHPYDDVTTPLKMMPNAKEALTSLKKAGHMLVLWSGRASRALLENPMRDPLVRAGARKVNMDRWNESLPLNRARYQQMLAFVDEQLPGVFDAVDDGKAGKFSFDVVVDDKALRYGLGFSGMGWTQIAKAYGA